jgi:hypothetical protein
MTPMKTPCLERRRGDRLPYPAEIVLVWHHDLDHPGRYQVLNAGDGGFRISTMAPMTEGMTGMAMMLLPEGKSINRSVMVAWTRPTETGEGFVAGVRYF